MRNMDDGPERWAVIQKLLERVRQDAPWVFGIHPKSFSLHHDWYHNYKSNLMANNGLKYLRIDPDERARLRSLWNRPLYLPALVVVVLVFISGGFLRRLIHQRREARGR